MNSYRSQKEKKLLESMEAKLTAEEESALFVPAEQDLQAAETPTIPTGRARSGPF